MNVLKLTLAAIALTAGSVAAHADDKAPPLNAPLSAKTLKVDLTRTVEIRVRDDRGAASQSNIDQDLAQNDFHGQRDTIFGD